MMSLYLVRHGVAIDREHPDCPAETERYLTPKGMDKTRDAAYGVAELGVKPDAMLTSPLLRATQTAEIFADVLDYPSKKIVHTNALKGTSAPADLFRELAKLKAKVVMCFGHEPHLHMVIGQLVHTGVRITELKKAGVALLNLERISPPQGQLIALYPPKTLRLLGKK